tara:strand:+ start:8927 stop:10204 length:1278 start_codon:yes stop_codon:yes gene_type:complete
MFEPFLFFVFTWKNNYIGFPLSVSRVLHLIVLLLLLSRLILKLVSKKKLIFVNNFFPENKYLLLFLILSFLSLFIGIIYGSFNLPQRSNTQYLSGFSVFSSRVIFEHIILIFNIFYFAILPKHLINTKVDFDYLFRIFKIFLIFSLFIGYADYLLSKFGIFDLVGRHIRDGIHVGQRFHGLAGEPRQAGAQLFFFMSMYILSCIYFKIKINKWVIFLLGLASLLTLSTTIFVAFIFLLIFLIIFRIIEFKLLLILIVILFFMSSVDRIQEYYNLYAIPFLNLLKGEDLQSVNLNILSRDLFPLSYLWEKFQNYEFLPILLGNGLGSASAVNNLNLDGYFGTANPNIQLVRLLFEHGLLSAIIFIVSMIWPIKYYTRNTDKKTINLYLFSMLLVLSVTLAVRSPISFIYLGVLTSFLNFNEKQIKH